MEVGHSLVWSEVWLASGRASSKLPQLPEPSKTEAAPGAEHLLLQKLVLPSQEFFRSIWLSHATA
jgi:hypothetical protein